MQNKETESGIKDTERGVEGCNCGINGKGDMVITASVFWEISFALMIY